MNKELINIIPPLYSRAVCQGCGREKGVRFIELGRPQYPGWSKDVFVYCQSCAREIIAGLSNAFPGDELPTWFRMMNKLSSYWEGDNE